MRIALPSGYRSRALRPVGNGPDVQDGITREVISGIKVMFYGRMVVIALLALWVLPLPAERSLIYLAALLGFGALGLPPYLLARRGHVIAPVFAAFIILDASLLTYALIVPPPFYVEGWTAQLNLRLPNVVFLGLFIASTALSYSPGLVALAGLSSATAWSVGFLWVALQPGSVLSNSRDRPFQSVTSEEVIRGFLNPQMVSVTNWMNQLVFLGLLTLILTVTVARSRRLVRRQVAAESARAALSRYFSPNIVKELSARESNFDRPVIQPGAVLFADMVGFTEMAERLPPVETVALLRSFHGRLAEVAFNHGGTLDKYIGDAIMIHFGTPRPAPDDPVRALACAAAMIETIRDWNETRARGGSEPVGVGIGVHYGDLVVGNIGHAQRLEFTVLGDAVNVASRLERLTRHAGTSLMASEDLIHAVRACGSEPTEMVHGLRQDSTRVVRGRRRPVAVWALPPVARPVQH